MTATLDPFDESTWNEDQKWYFDGIDKALREGADLKISNGKTENTLFLVHRFLENAGSTVRLFSRRLTRETEDGMAIYSNPHVLEAAQNALKSGVKVVVVVRDELDVEDGDPRSHPLVQSALNLRGIGSLAGLLALSRAAEKSVDWLDGLDCLHQWMTMDDRAFRLETDVENATAEVNFGRPDMAATLNRVFDFELLGHAKPLFAVSQ